MGAPPAGRLRGRGPCPSPRSHTNPEEPKRLGGFELLGRLGEAVLEDLAGLGELQAVAVGPTATGAIRKLMVRQLSPHQKTPTNRAREGQIGGGR